jgi:hypothetical protein
MPPAAAFPRRSRVGASFACAPGAEREKIVVREVFTGLCEIQKCRFFTRFDLQRFRIKTLLNFHNPGAKRAFGDSPAGRISARSAPGGEAAAKRAEREKFSVFDLSRDC